MVSDLVVVGIFRSSFQVQSPILTFPWFLVIFSVSMVFGNTVFGDVLEVTDVVLLTQIQFGRLWMLMLLVV
jgi:hypothetical protein